MVASSKATPLHVGIGNNPSLSALFISGNSNGNGFSSVCVMFGGELAVIYVLLEAKETANDSAKAAAVSSRLPIVY